MTESIQLLHPERAAHATIRGFLYQAALGVQRWLDLGADELLVCEGIEDLDVLNTGDGTGQLEQIKDYTARLGWNSRPVQKSLENFLSAFVHLRKEGERRTFVFTTTAELQPRPRGFDVLRQWSDAEALEEVVGAIRSKLAETAERDSQWLDEEPDRWPSLIASVRWQFGAPKLADVTHANKQRLIERLDGREGRKAAAELLEPRLLSHVLRAHAQRAVDARVLGRKSLDALLSTSEAELRTWASSNEGANLKQWRQTLRDELRVFQLEREESALRTSLKSGQEAAISESPASMLRAGPEVVGFHGREQELLALDEWLEREGAAFVAVFTGPGGAGKTRLFVEWTRRLRERGVSAGFLRQGASIEALFGALGPRVVVIDYAESQLEVVTSIVRRVAEDELGGHRPLRLVLLARQKGEWWEDLRRSDGPTRLLLLQHSSHTALDDQTPTIADRQLLFRDGVRRFGERLGIETNVDDRPPVLSDEEYERPLYVLMAALAAIRGHPLTSASDLLQETLDHESSYWNRAIRELELRPVQRKALDRGLRRSLVQLTLWGGRKDAEALRDLVNQSSGLAPDAHLSAELVQLLHRFYGDRGSAIRGLEPDLLGEHLVQRALEADTNEVLETALRGAGSDEARRLLTVLDRLAQREPAARLWLARLLAIDLDLLAHPAINVAVQSLSSPLGAILTQVVEEARPARLAVSIADRLNSEYQQTVVLRELAVTVSEIALAAEDRSDREEERAWRLLSLGARLSDIGRRADALEATQEATELFRKLTQDRPDILPSLAGSLSNLAKMMGGAGRYEEGLDVAREATELHRKLAQDKPDILPSLAGSLTNLANSFRAVGRLQDALQTEQEAIELLMELTEVQADGLPNLAMILSNHTVSLNELGHSKEALEFACPAIELFRKLTEHQADAFLPGLAMSLSNHAMALVGVGRNIEALESGREAIEILRRLAQDHTDAFLPDLAVGLSMQANALIDLGRNKEALESLREAIEILRRLAQDHTDRFLPYLASNLNQLVPALARLGRPEEALESGREAIEILQKLAHDDPDNFLPDLAVSLNSLASTLGNFGDHRAANHAFAESVKALARPFRAAPPAFAQRMTLLISNYQRSCRAIGSEPDIELVRPILDILERMNE